MGEFVSFQNIIMQASSKRPSESWQWKCTRHWTRWNTTLDSWSWPQASYWEVGVAITDILYLFQPNLEVSISRYIFYLVGIDTTINRLKILLSFFLCNFLSICFPTTRCPLCSTVLCIQNNNNSLSLCTLTQHITPCKHMRGDRSVSRQSNTAGTLAVSSSSTVKWTVCSSCCYIRCHSFDTNQHSLLPPNQ
jgi:hypothetical protein